MNEQTELPPGYSLKHNDCCNLFFVLKDGTTIRRANKQPISFRIDEEDQAVRFAWWHRGEGSKEPLIFGLAALLGEKVFRLVVWMMCTLYRNQSLNASIVI